MDPDYSVLFRRALTVAAGGILIGKSIERRSLRSLVAAFVGFELVLLGLRGPASRLPRRRRTGLRKLPEPDVVELASELSFPASDAPAY